jgi:hypothetical protein
MTRQITRTVIGFGFGDHVSVGFDATIHFAPAYQKAADKIKRHIECRTVEK